MPKWDMMLFFGFFYVKVMVFSNAHHGNSFSNSSSCR